MDEQVAAALAVMQRADADPLEVARAGEVLIGFGHARQLDAIVQMSQEDPALLDAQGAPRCGRVDLDKAREIALGTS